MDQRTSVHLSNRMVLATVPPPSGSDYLNNLEKLCVAISLALGAFGVFTGDLLSAVADHATLEAATTSPPVQEGNKTVIDACLSRKEGAHRWVTGTLMH